MHGGEQVMKTMTLEELQQALAAQGVPREYYAFKCPKCETVQSAADLIRAGAGSTFDQVESYLGYSCIGRFTGQKYSKRSKGAHVGCDWTLGGLLKFPDFVIVTPDGIQHPHFAPASPEEAQAHLSAVAMG
jgi:hypothetical protein